MDHLINTGNEQTERLEMVRMVRLELTRLAALEPKSSVYTNFTTSALNQKMGWTMGLEPTTTGVTIRGSTN